MVSAAAWRSAPGSAEAGAAPAGARGVRIGDREPGLQAVLVVEGGTLEQLHRGGVDDDADLAAARTEHRLLVVRRNVTVEEHLVREPTAPTGAHCDAERQLGSAFFLEQFLDLGRRLFGEGDHGGPPGDVLA